MNDNQTTEQRKMVNMLLIELEALEKVLDTPTSGMTLGEYVQEREKVLDGFIQAIAATLGSEREAKLERLARSLYADYHDEWPDRAEEIYAERMKELGIEVIYE